MAKHKGTSIQTIRKHLQKTNPQGHERLLNELSPQAKKAYLIGMPIIWIDMNLYIEIIEIAAPIIFPNDRYDMEKLGRLLVLEHLPGIFKVFFPLFTFDFLIKKATRVWSYYYDTGNARSEKVVKNAKGKWESCFVLYEYPNLSKNLRRLITGWLSGMGELCGSQHTIVKLDDSNPNRWEWLVVEN